MDTDQLMDEYLSGTLTDDELQLFEQKLRSDRSFAEEVEQYRLAWEVTQAHGRIVLREKLSSYDKVLTGQRVSLNRRRLWAVAASLALIICAVWILKPALSTPDQLFAEYFESYRDPVVPRGRSEASVRQTALAAYSSTEFRVAIAAFEKLSDPTDLDRFYNGLSYLQIDRPAAAIPMLTIVADGSSEYQLQSTWYLALAYVKMDDWANARILLKALVAVGTYNTAKAQKLLDGM